MQLTQRQQASYAANTARSMMVPLYRGQPEALISITPTVQPRASTRSAQQFTGTFPLAATADYTAVFSTKIGTQPLICTYVIKNEVTGHVWPGSTQDFRGRWIRHNWMAQRGQHRNDRLQAEFDKYGQDAFTITICECFNSTDGLLEHEEALGRSFDPALVMSYIVGSRRMNGYVPHQRTGMGRGAYVPAKPHGKISVARWFDFTSNLRIKGGRS